MAMASSSGMEGTVIFASVGRSHYAFDVFALDLNTLKEEVLTDGISVNFNAQFVDDDPVTLDLLRDSRSDNETKSRSVIHVSERTGASHIFVSNRSSTVAAAPSLLDPSSGFFYCDRPSIANDGWIIFASTKNSSNFQELRNPSTAVFSTSLTTGETKRLTPEGVADYSPALSPSKKWLMVASNGGGQWKGEIHELETSLWIFKSEDGSSRKIVVDRGGWPTWSDERTVFFHRRSPDDEWWSIYKAVLPENLDDLDEKQVRIERVTPPGVHAFTPAASRTRDWIAVATRRLDSAYRHVELFDLATATFLPVTLDIHPELQHLNPFVSATSDTLIGYHRCRDDGSTVPLLENVAFAAATDKDSISLLRIDGAFPSISKDGTLVAYNTDFEAEGSGVMVAKLDGSCRRRIFAGLAFTTCWNPCKAGTIYTSVGHIFAEERASVHIVAISFDEKALVESSSSSATLLESSVRVLTKPGTRNNAFPSASPDGKSLVFRSGRSGHKNLYIMDAELGEEGGVRALTQGPWIDTMPSWSPDGQWIAFSSSRGDPSGSNFALFLVRPDGSELHRVFPPAFENEKRKSRREKIESHETKNANEKIESHEKKNEDKKIERNEDNDNEGYQKATNAKIESDENEENEKNEHETKENESDGNSEKKNSTTSLRARVNHVCFSPDSRTLLFTGDAGGISAEPVSVPNQFQPYGELFSCALDGSGLRRWTHNAYEDGTPCWGAVRVDPRALSSDGQRINAGFQDCLWLAMLSNRMRQAAAEYVSP